MRTTHQPIAQSGKANFQNSISFQSRSTVRNCDRLQTIRNPVEWFHKLDPENGQADAVMGFELQKTANGFDLTAHWNFPCLINQNGVVDGTSTRGQVGQIFEMSMRKTRKTGKNVQGK